MVHRTGICVLLALWTLLVAPSTCGGGVLAHACPADEAPVCGHENDCPSDPCNIAHDVTTATKAPVAVAFGAVAGAAPIPPPDPAAPGAAAGLPSAGPRLSLPPAALPLRC